MATTQKENYDYSWPPEILEEEAKNTTISNPEIDISEITWQQKLSADGQDEHTDRYVTVRPCQKNIRVDIRAWGTYPAGGHFPTAQGLSLTVVEFENLASLVPKIKEQIKEQEEQLRLEQ
ncbi:hypothetical protein Hte_000431 [Hypoxylon texense]